MTGRPRIAWILGWAVDPARFAGLLARNFDPVVASTQGPRSDAAAPETVPGGRTCRYDHRLLTPEPGWDRALAEGGPWDAIVGYSLGALLVQAQGRASATLGARVALLAPFPAFPADAGMGGKIPRAELLALRGAVQREPRRAVAAFARFAGISDLVAPMRAAGLDPTHSTAGLVWGLDQLGSCVCAEVPPAAWLLIAGARDPLLDAGLLRAQFPSLVDLPEGAHHPGPLVAELARRWTASVPP